MPFAISLSIFCYEDKANQGRDTAAAWMPSLQAGNSSFPRKHKNILSVLEQRGARKSWLPTIKFYSILIKKVLYSINFPFHKWFSNNSKWPVSPLFTTFHRKRTVLVSCLKWYFSCWKKNGYLRLFLPSWAGKDVAPVPPGDGSSSVSAVEISDWLMLPFVSLQYMSTWLLLEFEEVFGAHSSPGCFFGMSVRKKKEGLGGMSWRKVIMSGLFIAFQTSTSTIFGTARSWKTSLSSTVSKSFKQKEVPG